MFGELERSGKGPENLLSSKTRFCRLELPLKSTSPVKSLFPRNNVVKVWMLEMEEILPLS